MSAIQQDFDRLALLDSEGWTHNNHYHGFLLSQVPDNCERALEIGCGTGAFARLLAARAEQVIALDLSPEMIRVARSRSQQIPNIEFHLADAMLWEFPDRYFDCITTIATLHHLQSEKLLDSLKCSLKPGGVLVILDLFEPERGPAHLIDAVLNTAALAVSASLRLIHNGRLKPPREVQAAWEAHGQHDSFFTMSEVRAFYSTHLPKATVRRHLLWRYSVVWHKS